jgi:hypothetical protein
VVETHPAEEQWLEEQVNMLKLRMFREETRRPAVTRPEWQDLVSLKTFIKDKASKWQSLLCIVDKSNLSNKLS